MKPAENAEHLRRQALEALIHQVELMVLRAEGARSDAQARANEHAGKVESRFDTFREEAQYLAYGQGLRREELLTALLNCRRLLGAVRRADGLDGTVRPGRIVGLSSESDEVRHYLIAPAGAGLRLRVGPLEVLVVSAAAPVGKALLGREVGDVVLLSGGGESREWFIDEIV